MSDNNIIMVVPHCSLISL